MGVGRRKKKKVCAVRYADESVMASMQEWTQPVPQDHTHQQDTHTPNGTPKSR